MDKKIIFETTFNVELITGESFSEYFSGKKGYTDIGGFSVKVPGYDNIIPFDFESTIGEHNDDGSYSFGNWNSFFERIYDVDPCHEEEWAENGLKQKDITAKLLASAEHIEEFYFNVCNMSDNTVRCFLEVKEMMFTDETDTTYSIKPEVLQDYNILRVAEQVIELVSPKKSYMEMKEDISALVKDMKETNLDNLKNAVKQLHNMNSVDSKTADFLSANIHKVCGLEIEKEPISTMIYNANKRQFNQDIKTKSEYIETDKSIDSRGKHYEL